MSNRLPTILAPIAVPVLYKTLSPSHPLTPPALPARASDACPASQGCGKTTLKPSRRFGTSGRVASAAAKAVGTNSGVCLVSPFSTLSSQDLTESLLYGIITVELALSRLEC